MSHVGVNPNIRSQMRLGARAGKSIPVLLYWKDIAKDLSISGKLFLQIFHLFCESSCDHLGECLLLGLRLPRQLGGAVAEARDVVLHVGDLVLLPLVPEYKEN